MPRKSRVELPPETWRKIQAAYELDPSHPTLDHLGRVYGVTESTVCKRARRESWHRKDSLAVQTIQAIERDNKAIVERTAATVTDRLTKQIADTLEPWIAKEKTRHIRTQVKRSKIALAQLDQHINRDSLLSPKDSSFIAKTADTWDQIMRRNLGLTDGTVGTGSLNLNILTNHSAVQINPSTGTGTAS